MVRLNLEELETNELLAVSLALQNPQRVIDALMVAASAPLVAVEEVAATPEPSRFPRADISNALESEEPTPDLNNAGLASDAEGNLEIVPKPAPIVDETTTHPLAPPVPPSTEKSTPVTNPGNVELDADGIPWDARIHSGGKTKLKAANTWKLGRNKDPELIKQVMAELKAAVAAPAAPANDNAETLEGGDAIPAAPSPSVFADSPAVTPPMGASPTPPAVPTAAVAPIPPAPQPIAVTPVPVNGEAPSAAALLPPLILSITERQSSVHGVTYTKAVGKALRNCGLGTINDLGIRPDLIATVSQELDAVWNQLNTPS